MTRDLELDGVLQEIVSLVKDFLTCDSCLIYLVEDSELVLFASSDENPKNIGNVRLKLNEGLTGWVARERRLLAISREAYNDSRFKYFKDLPQDTFEAFLSVPIISQNKVVGVINVQHQEPRIHTGGDMEMLSTLGEQIGCLLVLSRQKHPISTGVV
jgi:uroporphyrinogen-III synthase